MDDWTEPEAATVLAMALALSPCAGCLNLTEPDATMNRASQVNPNEDKQIQIRFALGIIFGPGAASSQSCQRSVYR